MSIENDDFMDIMDINVGPVGNVLPKDFGYIRGTTAQRVIGAIMANKVDAEAFAAFCIPVSAGVAFGCKVFNRGNTMQIVNVVKGSAKGWYPSPVGLLKYNQAFDVPTRWFTRKYINALARVNVLNEGFPVKGNFIWKMILLSKKMDVFRGVVESLAFNEDLLIDVRFSNKGYPFIVEPDASKLKGFIKPEHVGRGFYTNVFKDSVFAFKKDDLILSMEKLNKSNERVTKIAHNKGISVGSYPVFVCSDVPSELKDAFVTGGIFVPRYIMERLGVFRMTSSTLGMKGVSQPMPESFNGDCIIISKASCKAGLNGVLAAMGLEPKQQFESNVYDYVEDIMANRDSIDFMGHTLEGWLVDEEIRITNLYTLYGYVRPFEVKENPELGSYYVQAMDALEADASYDVVGELIDAINDRMVIPRPDKVMMKYQDLLNIYWSYGPEVHDAMVSRVVRMHKEYAPEWMKASQDVMIKGYGDVHRVTSEDLVKVVNHVWSTQDGKNVAININKWDSIVVDNGGQRYADLMNGYGEWPGLLNERGIVVTHGEHEFYIPGKSVLEHYIHSQDENDEVVFFSGPFGAIFKLFVSLRNENTEWTTKEIAHYMEVQNELLNDVISRFVVKGRYYVALPKWWDDEVSNVVVHMNRLEEGSRVLYSKDPVLFNKAMTDVTISSAIDSEVFGSIEENGRMDFVLSDVAFVSTELLVSQQNDTDGDLVCLRNLGGICPLYDGQIDYTSGWVNNYVEGEYDLEMKFKPYSVYTQGDLSAALQHAAAAKGDIGIMSSNLYLVQHILQIQVRTNVLTWDEAQTIKETYAIMVQEEAVKQIKANMDTGETFFEKASMYANGKDIYEAFALASNITCFSVDYDVLARFINSASSLIDDVHYHQFRSAIVRDQGLAFKYAKSKGNVMYSINPMMRSYYRNMESHMPKFGDLNPYIIEGMDDQLRERLLAKKAFTQSYINSKEVREGFKRVHGWINESGINLVNKPEHVTVGVLLHALKHMK